MSGSINVLPWHPPNLMAQLCFFYRCDFMAFAVHESVPIVLRLSWEGKRSVTL